MSPKRTINEKSARAEAPLGRAYDSKLMGRLVKYLHPYKAAVVLSLVLLVLHSLLGVSVPYLTKVAVDRYLAPTPGEVSFLDFLLPEDAVDGIIVIALVYLATLLVAFLSR